EAELTLKLFLSGVIDLRTTPGIAVRAGERPRVNSLARYQSARGDEEMSTLVHLSLPAGDENARRFLSLVDGTRDRGALAAESGVAAEEVETLLATLGRLALLVA